MVLRYLRYTTKAFALLVAFTLSTSSLLSQSINIVRYDTICPGETGCHTYMDTLFYEDFERTNESDYDCWNTDVAGVNSTGFFVGGGAYLRNNEYYGIYTYAYGNQGYSAFDIDLSSTAYPSLSNLSMLITPKITISNPENTSVSFFVKSQATFSINYFGDTIWTYDEVGFTYYNDGPKSFYDFPTLSDDPGYPWYINCGYCQEQEQNLKEWEKQNISLAFLQAYGVSEDMQFAFLHLNEGGAGLGVDNVLVYGPRCIEIPAEVSALPAGGHKTTTETVIRYGCTPTTITTHWYVSGQSDTTIVSTTQNPYTWNGSQYTASGIYSKTGFHDQHGCDSTAYLDLTIQSNQHNDTIYIDTTVCNAFYWDANDSNYSVSTHDTLRDKNRWGLDSLIILNLTVNYSTIKQDDTPENKCDSLVWTNIKNGRTFVFHSSGALYDTLSIRNHVNCDSIHESLFIITHSSNADTLTIMSCDTFRWVFNGIRYARDTLVSDTLKQGNQEGCDSIATLNLTITNNIIIDSSVIACDSFYWDVTDSTYTLSTTDSLKGISLDGCDSTLRLLLTIHRHTEHHDTLNVCDAHVWQPYAGKHDTIMLAGTYFDTLFKGNNVGCDSALILHLTLRHSTQSDTLKQVGCDSSKWDFNDRFYDSTGVYSDTIKNGNHEKCDSIGFLSLIINRSYHLERWDTLCDSFYWKTRNHTYTQSIDNATEPFRTVEGCDSSIILHIKIIYTSHDTIDTAACDSFPWHFQHDSTFKSSTIYHDTLKRQKVNSCDSIRVLQLTINHSSVMPPLTTLECDSMIWDFNHQTYYEDTSLIDTIPTHEGCDSIATLRLTIDHSPVKDTMIDSCDRYYWADKGKTYQKSGIYESRIPSAGNCDSIIKLHLTIRKSTDSIWRITACDTFVWQLEQDNVLTMSGVFSNTITNAVGCDSVRTLHLTINHDSPNDTHSVIVCNRYVWPANNTVYYESGIYSAHLRNIAGCDSVSTIRLTVSYNSTNHNEYVACDSIYWEGTDSVYFVSTTDTARLHNQYGCDSLVIQQLNVKHSTYGESQSHTACEQFVWHVSWDKTLKQSGIYHDTIANSVGCDSIIQLRLTIYRNDTVNLYETICDNNPYTMFGQKFVTSGDYPFRSSNRYSCDSILLLHLTVHPTYTIAFSDTAFREDLPYYFDGKYPFDSETRNEPIAFQTADGCDSIYYLTLFITIRQLGCDQRLVFPNVVTPNGDGQNDRFCIVGVDGGCYPTNELFIYNRWGTLVFHRKDISSCADAWEPDYMPAGTYYYRFQASNVYGAIERHGVVEVIKN